MSPGFDPSTVLAAALTVVAVAAAACAPARHASRVQALQTLRHE